MERQKFTREFKLEAVRLIRDRGVSYGRPVPLAAGRCGSITRHSLSVTSVWYRFVLRVCCFRVVGIHMATPGLVSEPPGITSIPTT